MSRAICFLVACAALLAGRSALADGKFFRVLDDEPVGVPYQRTLIVHHEGTETLLLQSAYLAQGSDPVKEIAWVVPVPGVPEFDSLPPGAADELFFKLAWWTAPRVIRMREAVHKGLLSICAIGLVLSVPGYFFARSEKVRRICKIVLAGSGVGLVPLMLALFFGPSFWFRSQGGDNSGVDVVRQGTAGVYDVAVIRGTDPGAVAKWLREGGFHFEESDAAVFRDYIDRGWLFVASKVSDDRKHDESELVSGGLAAPLIMKFDAPEPVYPLALTATAGEQTEMLIYVLSNTIMGCAGRLETRYAGWLPHLPWEDIQDQSDLLRSALQTFSNSGRGGVNLPILTKFRGTLTPAQMREDLVFQSGGPVVRPTVRVW